jgi:hypothetical protein
VCHGRRHAQKSATHHQAHQPKPGRNEVQAAEGSDRQPQDTGRAGGKRRKWGPARGKGLGADERETVPWVKSNSLPPLCRLNVFRTL